MMFSLFQETLQWNTFEKVLYEFCRLKINDTGIPASCKYYVAGEGEEPEEVSIEELIDEWLEYWHGEVDNVLVKKINEYDDLSLHEEFELTNLFIDMIIEGEQYILKKITLYYSKTIYEKIILKIYFSFYNEDLKDVFIATYDYDVMSHTFKFPTSEDNNYRIKFSSIKMAKDLFKLILTYSFDRHWTDLISDDMRSD